MAKRIVTPAEARALLNGTTPGPWSRYALTSRDIDDGSMLSPGSYVVSAGPEDDTHDVAHLPAELLTPLGNDAALLAAAPDLAATVASEPERADHAIADVLDTLAAEAERGPITAEMLRTMAAARRTR